MAPEEWGWARSDTRGQTHFGDRRPLLHRGDDPPQKKRCARLWQPVTWRVRSVSWGISGASEHGNTPPPPRPHTPVPAAEPAHTDAHACTHTHTHMDTHRSPLPAPCPASPRPCRGCVGKGRSGHSRPARRPRTPTAHMAPEHRLWLNLLGKRFVPQTLAGKGSLPVLGFSSFSSCRCLLRLCWKLSLKGDCEVLLWPLPWHCGLTDPSCSLF